MSSIPPEPDNASRVLIVDDQPLVRGGFRMLVDSQPDLTVIGEAGNGQEAVDFVSEALGTERVPDVVLMDVRMPRLNGIEATQAILAAHPRTKVIVLTTFDLDEYALDGIRAGASGFLLKDARPEELLEAIRTVARGDAVIAPSTTRRLLDHLIADSSDDDAAQTGDARPSPARAAGNATTPDRCPRRRRTRGNTRDWPRSRRVNVRSSSSWAEGCRTRRSCPNCSCPNRPSRRTCPTFWPSWLPATGCRPW